MFCTTCNQAAPQHELFEGQCLQCVGKERNELRRELIAEYSDYLGFDNACAAVKSIIDKTHETKN